MTDELDPESERRMLGQLFESTSDVLWMFSADWEELLFVNAAYEEVWGRDMDALAADSTDFMDGIHPDDRAKVSAAMDRISDGESAEMEFRVNAAEGYRRWVWTRARPIHDEDGAVDRIVGVTRDVTARRQYERELRRQNERLDEFASVVSHDLRSPLSVARGRVTIALEECDCDDHLEPVADAVERMGSIVEDTLTLARQGRTVDDLEWLDVAALAEESWAMVDADDAELVLLETFRVRGDPDRLRHAFENLFRNSVEHGSTGSRTDPEDAVEDDGPDVTVRIGTTDEVGFYVEDDGPGIPPEERERVFEPGHTTTEEGTGFGLAIVRRVAEAHGWTVVVTEGSDGGARFEFTGVELEHSS